MNKQQRKAIREARNALCNHSLSLAQKEYYAKELHLAFQCKDCRRIECICAAEGKTSAK